MVDAVTYDAHADADLAVVDVIACKAALSTVQQKRQGAREPARVLYYGAHSLLRTLRQHLAPAPSPTHLSN